MKKAYMTPSQEVIEIAPATMMAQSLGLSDEGKDTSVDGIQRSRENFPSNPNLWEQAW